MRFFKIVLFATLLISNPLLADEFSDKTVVNDPLLLKQAQALPNSGTIKIEKNNYVYLHVTDNFKLELFPILYKNLPNIDKNCLTPNNNPIGSHISLFFPGKLSNEQLKQFTANQLFHFKVVKILRVTTATPTTDQGILHTQWYLVEIESPTLLALMKKVDPEGKFYRLPLHISIAVAKFYQQNQCACMCDALHISP